jgi:asparagine synthase (glutamine-hydrolysing)
MVTNLSKRWSSNPSGRDVGGWIRRFGEGLPLDPARRYISWTSFMDSSMRGRLLPDFDTTSGRPEQRMLDVFQRGTGRMLDHVFRFDLNRYVASDLLQICDNMTMAHSLEARVPFCDVDLVNAMARIPASQRFPGYRLKPILRRIGRDYLPDEILNRKKQGFMIPIGRWFRQDLREYMEDQFDSRYLPSLLDHKVVRNLWNQHVTGQANHTHVLWAILLLSKWLRKSHVLTKPVR